MAASKRRYQTCPGGKFIRPFNADQVRAASSHTSFRTRRCAVELSNSLKGRYNDGKSQTLQAACSCLIQGALVG